MSNHCFWSFLYMLLIYCLLNLKMMYFCFFLKSEKVFQMLIL